MATPLDPRHRLVTTKYNPARTWTPENAVAAPMAGRVLRLSCREGGGIAAGQALAMLLAEG